MLRKLLCALVALLLASGSAQAMGRDEMRALWQELSASRSYASPYAQEPDTYRFSPGALTQAAQGVTTVNPAQKQHDEVAQEQLMQEPERPDAGQAEDDIADEAGHGRVAEELSLIHI